MFAILAAAGDIGNSIGPWLMGLITDHAQNTSLALWFRDWLSLSGEAKPHIPRRSPSTLGSASPFSI